MIFCQLWESEYYFYNIRSSVVASIKNIVCRFDSRQEDCTTFWLQKYKLPTGTHKYTFCKVISLQFDMLLHLHRYHMPRTYSSYHVYRYKHPKVDNGDWV